jgi:hypothetical protein
MLHATPQSSWQSSLLLLMLPQAVTAALMLLQASVINPY